MVSMLHAIVAGAGGRPVWFVHGARDGDHHPLRAEVEALAAASPEARVHVAYSRPRAADSAGRDYQTEGRVDAALLERIAQRRAAGRPGGCLGGGWWLAVGGCLWRPQAAGRRQCGGRPTAAKLGGCG